jgi:hypothetical protein
MFVISWEIRFAASSVKFPITPYFRQPDEPLVRYADFSIKWRGARFSALVSVASDILVPTLFEEVACA